MVKEKTIETMKKENEKLRLKLQELEDTLSAIRTGDIDAIVTSGPKGEQIYALRGAEYSYRVFIETMNEAAGTLTSSGTLVYCNKSLSNLLNIPMNHLMGRSMKDFVAPPDIPRFLTLLSIGLRRTVREEINVCRNDGAVIPVLLSSSPLHLEGAESCIILTDLSQLKEAQKQLQKAHDELEQQVEQRTHELQRSKEITEQLIQYAPTGIYELTFFPPRFVNVNDVMCTYLGYTREELLTMNPMDLLDETSKQVFQERLQKIGRNAVPSTVEYVFRTKKGEIRYAELNVSFTYEKKKPVGAFVIAHDVTELRLNRKLLEEAERKYRTVADHTYDFEFWIDETGHFLYASPSCKSITGYTHDEFIADPSLRKTIIHPEDKQMFQTHVNAERKKKQVGELEYRIIRKNGEERWVHHVCQPIMSQDGVFLGTRGSNRDVTERKKAEMKLQESEAKYRALIETTSDFIWEVDAQGRYAYCSPQMKTLWSLNSKEMIGKTPFDQMSPDAREKGLKFFQDAVKSKKPFSGIQVPSLDGHGDLIMIEINGVPFFDTNGKLLGYRGITRDITERKRAEEALRESEERFRALNETSPIGVGVSSADGVILYTNTSYEQILGYQHDELLGKNAIDLYMNTDTRNSLLNSIKETGAIKNIETQLKRKDGTPVWVLINIAHVWYGGKRAVMGTIQDITERKQSENQLSELNAELEQRVIRRTEQVSRERQRLFDVLETLPSYVILLDRNYHSVFANKVFRERFGESYEKCCYELLFNKKEPCAGCETYKVLQTNAPHHWEWTGPDKRIYDVYDYPFATEDGSTMILEMGIDITEQKRTHESLRSTSQYVRSLIEASLDPLVTISSNGKITDVNEATINVTGFAREELIGTDFSNYFTEPKEAKKVYRQVFSRGFVTDYPLTIRHKNGSETHVLYNASVYKDDSGKIRGIFAAARDVTERKRAEEELQNYKNHLEELVKERTQELRESEVKYRNIVENTSNLIMVTQPDGIVSYLSPTCDDILGHPPQELIGTRPSIIHSDDEAKVQQVLTQAIQGKEGKNFEYRIITKQGITRWISHSWSPIYFDKKLQSIVSIIEDITARKEAENRIQKLNQNLIRHTVELAATNKELESFSYSVSHDLRAPLRSIDGFSQALFEDYIDVLPEQGKDYLQRVRNATRRMEALIDDMLRLSRLTRVEMMIQNVDLGKIAGSIIDEFKKAEPTRNVTFVTYHDLVVEGDSNLLSILLKNLLENAWKFTKKRTQAQIEFGKINQGNETVFFIRDNGAGFDMKYSDKLFKPFQRLHEDADYSGTGIGLGIVSRIIHRHGGRIWAEAEEEKGATFYFTLGEKTQ